MNPSQQSQFANGREQTRISRLLSLALPPYSMGVQVVPEHQRLLERLAIHAYMFVGIDRRAARGIPPDAVLCNLESNWRRSCLYLG